MRTGQLLALVAIFAEARIALNPSWNQQWPWIVTTLIAALVLSELVRVGRRLSMPPLVWIGHAVRFTTLGWAGTGLLALFVLKFFGTSLDDGVAQGVFWSSGVVALLPSFYAFSIGRDRIVVRRYKVGLTTDRPDLRITALSDFHLGEYVSAAHIRKAVNLSNNESPDIVLLLGDFVDQDGLKGPELIRELTNLSAKLGVFAVLGNHDVDCTDMQTLVGAFESDPHVSLVRNSSVDLDVVVNDSTKTLRIIGFESHRFWWSPGFLDVAQRVLTTADELPGADYTIAASHHPEVFDLVGNHRFDLMVAGHTHGGQLASPVFGRVLNAGRLVSKYVRGLYRSGSTILIMTTGIGVGVIPARLGVPAEVTLIEIAFGTSDSDSGTPAA